MTPLQWDVLKTLLVFLLGLISAYVVNRLTKRQDRRVDWYDAKDEQWHEMLRRLDGLSRQIADCEEALKQIGQLRLDLQLLQQKVGIFWKSVEDVVAADFLKPRRGARP